MFSTADFWIKVPGSSFRNRWTCAASSKEGLQTGPHVRDLSWINTPEDHNTRKTSPQELLASGHAKNRHLSSHALSWQVFCLDLSISDFHVERSDVEFLKERTSDVYLIRLNRTPGLLRKRNVDCHATELCCVTMQTININVHLGRTICRNDNSKSIAMLYLSQKHWILNSLSKKQKKSFFQSPILK